MSSLIDTRIALHDLARLVLAHGLEGTTELVTLRATPGGFGQPERLVDALQRRIRVDGTQLVVQHGENERWHPIGTLAAAADFAGLALPDGEADRALAIDVAHAATLARLFDVTDSALAELRRRHADEGPTITQLFPHHFDLAITVSEVNVGASPGDADHDEPYLYVGPWNVRPHPMWNETWGVSKPFTDAVTAADAVEFFEVGLAAAR